MYHHQPVLVSAYKHYFPPRFCSLRKCDGLQIFIFDTRRDWKNIYSYRVESYNIFFSHPFHFNTCIYLLLIIIFSPPSLLSQRKFTGNVFLANDCSMCKYVYKCMLAPLFSLLFLFFFQPLLGPPCAVLQVLHIDRV